MVTLFVSSPRRRGRSRSVFLLLTAGALGLGPAAVAAQTPTIHVQGAVLDNVATTVTLGLQFTTPLGEAGLPSPGQQTTEDVRSWLFAAGASGGISLAHKQGYDDGFTATGHIGLMYRTGALVEQVGIVAYGNTEPLGAGPALRAKIAIVDLHAGGMWMKDGLGFRWFCGGGLSLQFLLDVFTR